MSDNISLSNNHQNWLKMSGDRPLSYALVCVCVYACVLYFVFVCVTLCMLALHICTVCMQIFRDIILWLLQ